jgi:hypothetical protein
MFLAQRYHDLSYTGPKGVNPTNFFNQKLCWQAHDDYYDCIDLQIGKGDSNLHLLKL